MSPKAAQHIEPLPRGGVVVRTSRGPVQFGVPAETIKDTMGREHGVPGIFVLGPRLFDAERGLHLAELEFPAYFNFFILGRRTQVIATAAQRERVRCFMSESLFGPAHIDLSREVRGRAEAVPWLPDLPREMAYFRAHPQFPDRQLRLDDLIEFHLLEETPQGGGVVELEGLTLSRLPDGGFLLEDPERLCAPLRVPPVARPSLPTRSDERPLDGFVPPAFGVTLLGSGHGFDAQGKTTGFVLWVNGRGILVDPPVDTAEWLEQQRIPCRCVDAILLTHCHSDHDAGTLRKALQVDRMRLYTTHTVWESFLRKSEAITGIERERFGEILRFVPVPLGRPFRINGARFVFEYTLHSIPTIGFTCELDGRSLVYTADTHNDPERIRQLETTGVLSPGRARRLLDFPWDADLVIHEAGVPPLHTPVDVLARLPEDVKRRLYLVHTTEAQIPPGCGLTLAPTGLEHTLVLDAHEEPQRNAVRWLVAMRAVEPFRKLPVARAIDFLEFVRPLRVDAGQHVFRKGDPGDCFYMVLEGRAVAIGGGPRRVFETYDYFGQSALLLDRPRASDVVAQTPLHLLAMDRDDLLTLIQGTSIEERMRQVHAARRSGAWSLLSEHPILGLPRTAQRYELAAALRERHFDPGQLLLSPTPGEPPGAYLLAEGLARSERPGRLPELHGPGAFVGDLRGIGERLHGSQLALTAQTPLRAFFVSAEELRVFLRGLPGIYLRLLQSS